MLYHKLVPALYSILVNSPKYSQTFSKYFGKSDILKEDFQNPKKIELFFVFEPNLFFIKEHYKGKKRSGTSYQSSFGLSNMLISLFSLVRGKLQKFENIHKEKSILS